ncbi:Ubiquitin carboxyl-terminal hydrolase 7, partial [Pseudolycoriella hygida]
MSRLWDSAIGTTDEFVVRQVPWVVRVFRNDGSDWLSLVVECKKKDQSHSCSCLAFCKFKIISLCVDDFKFIPADPLLFSTKSLSFEYSEFILMSELLDRQKGYTKDDAITMEVTLKVSVVDSFVNRMKVYTQIADKPHISVKLICLLSEAPSWSCKAGAVFKLISYSSSIVPNEFIFESFEFTPTENEFEHKRFITMKHLMSDKRHFIEGGKVVLDVKIWAEKPQGIESEEYIMCPLCARYLIETSAVPATCGHLFCDE